jgi:hypothetical protein
MFAAAPAGAVEINPEFSLSGYIVGSARYVDQGGQDNTVDLDATKLLTGVNTGPVSGTASLFAAGTDDISLLDAYFTYQLAEGASVTAGKFLSYHGYEAFDIPNMLQITYSNENSEAIIPGYHKGIRFDMATGDSKFGFALLDSVYNSDGEIDDGIGFEGYYTLSTGNTTAYLGFAYDNVELGSSMDSTSLLADLWVQVTFDSMMLAGEVAYKTTDDDLAGDVDSFFISGLAQWTLSDANHVLVRLTWGEDDYDLGGAEQFMKYTLAARQKVSDNFTVVEELSYSTFDTLDDKLFLGVQGRFTF